MNFWNWRTWNKTPRLKKLYAEWYSKKIRQKLLSLVVFLLTCVSLIYLFMPHMPPKAVPLEPIQKSLDAYGEPSWEKWYISINDSTAVKVNRTLTPTFADALPFDAWGLLDESLWVLPIPSRPGDTMDVRLLIIIDRSDSTGSKLLHARATSYQHITSIPSSLFENNPEFYPFVIEAYDASLTTLLLYSSYLFVFALSFFLFGASILKLLLEYSSLKKSVLVTDLHKFARQLDVEPPLLLAAIEDDLLQRAYHLSKIIFTKNWIFLLEDEFLIFSVHNVDVERVSKPSRSRLSTEHFLKFTSIVGQNSVTVRDSLANIAKIQKTVENLIQEQLESVLTQTEKDVNHYEMLGVESDATMEEIKRAYKSRARQLHPDRNPSPKAKEMWLKVCESYALLMEESKKEAYDELLARKAKMREDLKKKED